MKWRIIIAGDGWFEGPPDFLHTYGITANNVYIIYK